MDSLRGMVNLGKIAEKRLAAASIFDKETLLSTGSKEAFLRLLAVEGDTCFSTLCALEGAVRGIRWHDLPPEDKKELRVFFDSVR